MDHHKTATEQFGVASAELPANLEVNLDMERSGATMALDYFRPTVQPRLLWCVSREPYSSPEHCWLSEHPA